MFTFRSTILSSGVRAREAVKGTVSVKNGANMVIDKFRTSIALENLDLARKLCLNKVQKAIQSGVEFGFGFEWI